MLSYVFWHWSKPDVDARLYEDAQRAFHVALAREPIAGFHGSLSVQPSGAPIPCERASIYEDWYFVSDFASLGVINHAAIAGSRTRSHDAAAALAANGAGGIYALRCGLRSATPRRAYWFSKPAGTRYDALMQALTPIVERAGAALWMRQMVLGPGREFCIHANDALELPENLAALQLDLREVLGVTRPRHE